MPVKVDMDLQTARRIVMDDLSRQMNEGSE
jgi:hypothetical protein